MNNIENYTYIESLSGKERISILLITDPCNEEDSKILTQKLQSIFPDAAVYQYKKGLDELQILSLPETEGIEIVVIRYRECRGADSFKSLLKHMISDSIPTFVFTDEMPVNLKSAPAKTWVHEISWNDFPCADISELKKEILKGLIRTCKDRYGNPEFVDHKGDPVYENRVRKYLNLAYFMQAFGADKNAVDYTYHETNLHYKAMCGADLEDLFVSMQGMVLASVPMSGDIRKQTMLSFNAQMDLIWDQIVDPYNAGQHKEALKYFRLLYDNVHFMIDLLPQEDEDWKKELKLYESQKDYWKYAFRQYASQLLQDGTVDDYSYFASEYEHYQELEHLETGNKWFSIESDTDKSQKAKHVLFFSHPNDASCLSKISNDIKKFTQNTLLWVAHRPVNNIEKVLFLNQLSQMQLVVIPISSSFLDTDNDAKDFVFPSAQKLTIPVLPILLESGLETKFNRTCGELQCLNLAEADETTIPYDIKLSQFLDEVLVSDSKLRKIREAFRSYIFLSYRKKDRRYAQELMRMIHSKEFTQDIAIWYDEFLVPGEDFNETILKNLDKSKLFAMVVTPNLLEEGNYVAAKEYPYAKDSGKRILPVELVKTDRYRLVEHYPSLPDVVPIHDDSTLQNRMEKLIPAENLCPSDADEPTTQNQAEKDYLLGSAYLHGIDVEVDPVMGKRYLLKACKADYPDAYLSLASIYRYGITEKRNPKSEAALYLKYIQIMLKRYYENHETTDLYCCLEPGLRFAEISRQHEKYERTAEYLTEILKCLSECSKTDEDPKWNWDLWLYRYNRECFLCAREAVGSDVGNFMLANCLINLFVYTTKRVEAQKSVAALTDYAEALLFSATFGGGNENAESELESFQEFDLNKYPRLNSFLKEMRFYKKHVYDEIRPQLKSGITPAKLSKHYIEILEEKTDGYEWAYLILSKLCEMLKLPGARTMFLEFVRLASRPDFLSAHSDIPDFLSKNTIRRCNNTLLLDVYHSFSDAAYEIFQKAIKLVSDNPELEDAFAKSMDDFISNIDPLFE